MGKGTIVRALGCRFQPGSKHFQHTLRGLFRSVPRRRLFSRANGLHVVLVWHCTSSSLVLVMT